ncbi:MAG: hypothetical protein LUG86_05180, partial [Oscillospiraceae bacterium]|nr:hypothetical protein [Oscillospiraceae bacterium]
MKNKISILLVAGIVFLTSASSALAGTRDTYKIPKLNNGYKKVADRRSGSYSNVRVNCHAVYPTVTGMSDNFTKMRVKIRNQDYLQSMSAEKVIVENSGSVTIDLIDSMLKYKDIYFCL